MIIDVWFDFSCPFCYMAHTNLLKALENKKSEDVNIRYNTFELFPAQFTNKPENFTESFARKYNRTVDEAKTLLENMEKKAKYFGLNIDVNKLYEVNTKKAHILLQYAKTHDICEKYVQNVFNAYFNGENIDDEEVLIKALKDAGIKIQNINSVLETTEYESNLKQNASKARNLGVKFVPVIIFGGKLALSGAKSVKDYENALEDWKNANPREEEY